MFSPHCSWLFQALAAFTPVMNYNLELVAERNPFSPKQFFIRVSFYHKVNKIIIPANNPKYSVLLSTPLWQMPMRINRASTLTASKVYVWVRVLQVVKAGGREQIDLPTLLFRFLSQRNNSETIQSKQLWGNHHQASVHTQAMNARILRVITRAMVGQHILCLSLVKKGGHYSWTKIKKIG